MPIIFLIEPSLAEFAIIILSISLSFFIASITGFLPSIVAKLSTAYKFLNFSLISTILPQVMLPSGHGP